MKSLTLSSQFYIQTHPIPKTKHKSPSFSLKNPTPKINLPNNKPLSEKVKVKVSPSFKRASSMEEEVEVWSSRYVMVGAVSIGLVMLLMGCDDAQKALAFGPEGPLMEDFWDNMRRYGLYALTVSSGVLYAVFQPLYELLKNPISAILVVIILGGAFYIVSQVVSAMVGITEFSYQYTY